MLHAVKCEHNRCTIPYMFQHFLWVPSSGSPDIG